MGTEQSQTAERISAFATNLLFSAIVLVLLLGVGRQVLVWWGEEETPRATAPDTALGDPNERHILQFSDQPWSIARRSFSGDKPAAAAALRGMCKESLGTISTPDRRPGELERGLLERLADVEPTVVEPGRWRLYELNDAFPMALGVADVDSGVADGENPRKKGPGVLTWGLAMPVDNSAENAENWTLFTFQPTDEAGDKSGAAAKVPLPPQCRPTLSISVADGGMATAFSGRQSPESWKRFYDRWFEENEWTAGVDWQRSGDAWFARFNSPEADRPRTADIRFGPDGRGGLSGFMMITPKAKVETSFKEE